MCILLQWSADVGMGRQTPPSSFFLSMGWHRPTSPLLPPQAACQPFHSTQSSAGGGDLTWAPWPCELLGVSSSILPVPVWQEPELLVLFLATGRTPARITLLSGICAASHKDPGAELLLSACGLWLWKERSTPMEWHILHSSGTHPSMANSSGAQTFTHSSTDVQAQKTSLYYINFLKARSGVML